MRIAHIAAHTGGGVGSVLGSFFQISASLGVANDLFCLDSCKSNFADLTGLGSAHDGLALEPTRPFIGDLDQHDMIVIHYWNHPLMAKFLVEADFPAARIVVWSHNSGLFEPHVIPSYLFQLASRVLFSSLCSYSSPNLQYRIHSSPEKFGSVHSTHVLDEFLKIGLQRGIRGDARRLLYVGTVSDSKLHPQSAEIFAHLSKVGFDVQVVGGPDHRALEQRVSDLGGEIEVIGPVSHVQDFYRNADIFVYPLRREHYGTGEQVILEAMASGLPVVAFDNPAESTILSSGGGTLVATVSDYVQAVKTLQLHSDLYGETSAVGQRRARQEFSAARMTETFLGHLSDVMKQEKRVPASSARQVRGLDELAMYALNSLFDGDEVVRDMIANPKDAPNLMFSRIERFLRNPCERPRWLSKTKSTPRHYLQYFPDSAGLLALADEMAVVEDHT